MISEATPVDSEAELRDRVARLESDLAAARAHSANLIAERDLLREAYRQLELQVQLQRRRLFVAKAERIDTQQLEIEFAATLAKLNEIAATLPADVLEQLGSTDGTNKDNKKKRSPTGRRDLRDVELPEERIVLVDPLCDGTAEPIGTEETCQIMWRRGGPVRVVTVRTKYRSAVSPASTAAEETMPVIVTTPVPPQILTRSIATASLLAHIVSDKFCDGLPLYRQEDRFSRLGCRIDRGSMSRWIEDLGMIMGSSLVKAMRDDAFANAFCISTDATGVLVQPLATGDKQRRACRRGHYFVQIADDDHIFFEYTPKETSAAVGEMFKGYSGYIQADAKSVYDFLFRPPEERVPLDDHDVDLAVRHELGCWSHCRTKMWEAAITTKDVVAREPRAHPPDLRVRSSVASSPACRDQGAARRASSAARRRVLQLGRRRVRQGEVSARILAYGAGLRASPAGSTHAFLRRWSIAPRQQRFRASTSEDRRRPKGVALRR